MWSFGGLIVNGLDHGGNKIGRLDSGIPLPHSPFSSLLFLLSNANKTTTTTKNGRGDRIKEKGGYKNYKGRLLNLLLN